MSVEDHTSVIASHCGLELVDPYAGIYREDFSLQSLQAFGRWSAEVCKDNEARNKYRTGRPTGASNFQSDFTPMAVG